MEKKEKRFAVAYISFFDNVLQMKIVEAENELEACRCFLGGFSATTLDELKQEAYDGDSAINCLEIPETGEAERLA